MIPSESAVQLGLVVLNLRSVLQSTQRWSGVSDADLDSFVYKRSGRELNAALSFLLQNGGLGFGGEYRIVHDKLVVRCWIKPMDAEGASWNEGMSAKEEKTRTNSLSLLFIHLRGSWKDETADLLLTSSPEDTSPMAILYITSSSPPEPSVDPAADKVTAAVQSRLQNYEAPVGIRPTTILHKRQIRSVAKMLRVETFPGSLIDPRWTPISEIGRSGTYYLDLTTCHVCRNVISHQLPRGGILNEPMGSGKSLVTLALMLASLHQPCLPPPSATPIPIISDARDNLYPSSADRKIRTRAGYPQTSRPTALPTLAQLCADIVAQRDPMASRSRLLTERNFPHLNSLLRESRPLYYEIPPPSINARLGKPAKKAKRLYLANTTLLVVPKILVDQWMVEIEKHVVDGIQGLSVLKVSKGDRLPDIRDLICYDVVLMSLDSFKKELKYPSELEKARWKRLVLDEGHIAGLSKTSDYMLLIGNLSIERRWAVTGTPTKNLQQVLEVTPASAMPQQSQTPKWSARDIADVTDIGHIAENFLLVEPFCSDKSFQKTITSPLRPQSGPRFGAVRRLRNLLSAIMVKHESGIFDSDSPIPLCTRTTEYLTLHPMQTLTYNALMGNITANVHTAGKEGVDYFLHAKNVQSFKQVIANLRLACFWYSSPAMGVARTIEVIKWFLDTEKSKMVYAPEIRAKLEEASCHLELAQNTPGWLEWMENADAVPFEHGDLPVGIRNAWSDSPGCPDVIATDSLLWIQHGNKRGASEADLSTQGEVSREYKRRNVQNLKMISDNKGSKKRSEDPVATTRAAEQPTSISRKVTSMKQTEQTRNDNLIMARIAEAAANANPDLPRPSRPLASTVQTVSRSVKVNFVIKTVLEADIEDKFVIFGDKMELHHMRDALSLFDIGWRYAGPGIPEADLADSLRSFAGPATRVCLLDLRMGSRGLNLVVANRLILLGPVWNQDTLAQAVKRIDRIGQTRPTRVQILAIKGTIEEKIARRGEMRERENDSNGEMLYSRAAIENPEFVYSEEYPTELFPVNLVPLSERETTTPPPASPRPGQTPSPASSVLMTPTQGQAGPSGTSWTDVRSDASVADIDMEVPLKREASPEVDSGPPKKRARVRWAQ